MTYKMVVFDWDGTLLNSTAAIARAIQAACMEAGLPDPGVEIASYVIGLGLSEALRHAAPGASDEQVALLVEGYRKHYLSNDQALSLFAGAIPLLQALNEMNVICAVATGKSRHGLNRAMSHSNTSSYIASSRCADECFSKPHPQMLLELMDEFNLSAKEVVMIGDTTHDLNMAKAAGVHALSVQTGAHSVKMLEQVAHLKSFHSINELAPWLLSTLRGGPVQ